ncbi:MAG TPA: flagellar basal body L-ring protein FlgH [Terriglobales bacterium]|nr:flagellar basal body L-ring protein FlgH [Terriglobales bacterium]
MVRLGNTLACLAIVLVVCAQVHGKKDVQSDSRADYLARLRSSASPNIEGPTPGSLWIAGGSFTNLAGDYKARNLGDLIIINIVEQTLAEASGAVASQRKFDTASGVTGLAGRISTGGINTLLSANSDTKLQGQAQTASRSRLQTSVAGEVIAVLPNGNLVVEARRQLVMNNEKQTVLLRGVVRPGDVTPENTVISTQLSNLEVELRGKGVVSDATRRPNWAVRALMWLTGF